MIERIIIEFFPILKMNDKIQLERLKFFKKFQQIYLFSIFINKCFNFKCVFFSCKTKIVIYYLNKFCSCNFSIRFENGKAVEVRAAKGQDALEKMIAMDEGAPCLGECALIPCDSPINNTGILFYNTLFDENASCHLALGRGFENCVEGFENMTQEQLRAMGVNDSMIHVDFMIGAPDLDITGILPDGTRVPVFRNGEWCF